MPRRVLITVAEVSADLHASHLAERLLALDPSLQIHACGGQRLAGAGATILHETVSRAAMGFAAVGRAAEMRRMLKSLRAYFDTAPPDLLICCDSWAINHHIATLAHDRKIPVLYYIAPQTWASREGRIKKMRKLIDNLACILPFEESYFREHGLSATFVGHPLFDELPNPRPTAPIYDGSSPPVIGLLCGSRRSIARTNTPRMMHVAGAVLEKFPQAKFLVPTTDPTHAYVAAELEHYPFVKRATEISRNSFDALVPRCHFCLTVSGTAALHVAAYRVPLAVVYHGNPVLWHTLGRWLLKTRTFSLVNLLSNREQHIAREFIPWYGPAQPVVDHIIALLKSPEKLRAQQRDLAEMIAPLDKPGASLSAARMAMDLLSVPRPG
jgi:lipid-A-disaccharide synthase